MLVLDAELTDGKFYLPPSLPRERTMRVQQSDPFFDELMKYMTEPIGRCDDCDEGREHRHGCFVVMERK